MKSFGKWSCLLCMMERVKILESCKLDEEQERKKTINSRSEIYGGCRHRTRFHRYTRNIYMPSTDEGGNPERVKSGSGNNTQDSQEIKFLGRVVKYCQTTSRVLSASVELYARAHFLCTKHKIYV